MHLFSPYPKRTIYIIFGVMRMNICIVNPSSLGLMPHVAFSRNDFLLKLVIGVKVDLCEKVGPSIKVGLCKSLDHSKIKLSLK